MSLRLRLPLWYLATRFVLLALFIGYFLDQAYWTLIEQTDTTLTLVSDQAQGYINLQEEPSFLDVAGLIQVVNQIDSNLTIQIVSPDGQVYDRVTVFGKRRFILSESAQPDALGHAAGPLIGRIRWLLVGGENVRNGARLILNYDSASNSFIGTVQNTTNVTLTRVRIEVHLSNSTELGPTTPTDLASGQILDVTLPATAQAFESWIAHAEVGAGEGGEGDSD